MSKTTKKYWKWDDAVFNKTAFKLGTNINNLTELIPTENFNEFTTPTQIPWVIQVNENKCITRICYRKFFFSLLREDLWDLYFYEFIENMNHTFEETTEDFGGDKLIIIFRDFFVAVVCITSKEF